MNFRLEYRRYALPFRVALRTAHGWWSVREGAIVRIESEDGKVGWGEIAPIEDFGTESLDEALAALNDCSGVLGGDLIERLPSRLRCTRGAIREAIHSLARDAAKDATSSVATNGHLQVSGLLPAGRAAIDVLKAKAEMGFRVFKWKIGLHAPIEELPLLDDLLAALPSGGKLRLDANGAFDRRRAEAWLTRCAGLPVEYLEQPISPGHRGAEDIMLGLAADYPTPLALDESLGGDADVERWLENGWSGVWVVKTGLFCDPAAMCRRLEKAGARVVFSSALETRVGTRAALIHAFAWRGTPMALGFGIWPLFADARFDGGNTTPWIHSSELNQLDQEEVWNALS